MPSKRDLRRRSVFLNVPFDHSYEKLFVALLSSLVAIGRAPRCVLEVPETGNGRLPRIFQLIKDCPMSVHDVSRVGLPVRFNMPFELGIAFAICRLLPGHGNTVLEAHRYRLDKTLSDLKAIDPGIHGGRVTGVIACILSSFGRPSGNPATEKVLSIHRRLWKAVPILKKAHGRQSIFSRAIFLELVAGAVRLAQAEGLVKA